MPLWWFYPQATREAFLRRWREKLPAFGEMIAATRVLTVGQLRRLFPHCQVHVERFLGIPKSYVAYRFESARRARR